MYVYDFLKDNKSVNVSFSAKNGSIKFAAPKQNKNCMKSKDDFLKFLKKKLLQCFEKYQLPVLYVTLYIGKNDQEKTDLLCFYKDYETCDKEMRGNPHVFRKCYCDEIDEFINLFGMKDFTADTFERSWYFANKSKEKKFITSLNGAPQKKEESKDFVSSEEQLDLDALMQAAETEKKKPKSKKQQLRERLCLENGIDIDCVAPWEDVNEVVVRQKEDDNPMVTAKLYLSRDLLNRIIAEFDVKVIDRDDIDQIVDPVEEVTDFFASL